jgi:hypothetical protein
MIPDDIIDIILSYCPGYLRADLRRKNISVKLRDPHTILDIGNKLELIELQFLQTCYIEQKNTDNHKGYVCKSIAKSDGSIHYIWVIICR